MEIETGLWIYVCMVVVAGLPLPLLPTWDPTRYCYCQARFPTRYCYCQTRLPARCCSCPAHPTQPPTQRVAYVDEAADECVSTGPQGGGVRGARRR